MAESVIGLFKTSPVPPWRRRQFLVLLRPYCGTRSAFAIQELFGIEQRKGERLRQLIEVLVLAFDFSKKLVRGHVSGSVHWRRIGRFESELRIIMVRRNSNPCSTAREIVFPHFVHGDCPGGGTTTTGAALRFWRRSVVRAFLGLFHAKWPPIGWPSLFVSSVVPTTWPTWPGSESNRRHTDFRPRLFVCKNLEKFRQVLGSYLFRRPLTVC